MEGWIEYMGGWIDDWLEYIGRWFKGPLIFFILPLESISICLL